jgi:hypothetical protein
LRLREQLEQLGIRQILEILPRLAGQARVPQDLEMLERPAGAAGVSEHLAQ